MQLTIDGPCRIGRAATDRGIQVVIDNFGKERAVVAQVNAYYGLALAQESLGDLDGALGAMRTYVHLSDERDQYQRRAWSAIWEWQSRRSAQVGSPSEPGALLLQGGS